MIILDTHVWIWCVHGDPSLPKETCTRLDASGQTGLGISAISCWEVAKLVEYGRLLLPYPVSEWLRQALAYPGVRLIELSPDICVESTRLPSAFHRDPADQIIVATARILAAQLVTLDGKILSHSHVKLASSKAHL